MSHDPANLTENCHPAGHLPKKIMANPAQDEFDSLISRNTATHPTRHRDDTDSDVDSPAASDDESRDRGAAKNAWKSGTTTTGGGRSNGRSIQSGRVGRTGRGLRADGDESDAGSDEGVDNDGEYKPWENNGGSTNGAKDHLPSRNRVAPANTGPKGVITDAWQAADRERARKLGPVRSQDVGDVTRRDAGDGGRKGEWERGAGYAREDELEGDGEVEMEEEEEDGYVEEWRRKRMREMAERRQGGGGGRGGDYSGVDVVDAFGYLKAVEEAPRGTVVAVFIYDEDVCFFPLAPPFHTIPFPPSSSSTPPTQHHSSKTPHPTNPHKAPPNPPLHNPPPPPLLPQPRHPLHSPLAPRRRNRRGRRARTAGVQGWRTDCGVGAAGRGGAVYV